MSFTAPVPVASGRPYAVLSVRSEPPIELAQFLGITSFVIEGSGEILEVSGIGCVDGEGILFQEKSPDAGGKDVRVWHVTVDGDGFEATSAAAF